MADKICNCQTCGHGRSYWIALPRGKWKCPNCDGDPLVKGSGRPDHDERARARMVARFGPRQDGDLELVKKYRNELHGYDVAVPLESLE